MAEAAFAAMAKVDEQVLVVPRTLFEKLGAFQGLQKEPERYLEAFLKRENNFFMPRSRAEDDPTHKQIIPYVIFTHAGKILHYVRGSKSGEKRLVAKGSIGIGGHISAEDDNLFTAASSFNETAYKDAVHREIREELTFEGGFEDRVAGLINDDTTEVGKVHLGVVHIVNLETSDVQPGEKAIAELGFLSIDELRARRDALETWSQIILDGWNEIGA